LKSFHYSTLLSSIISISFDYFLLYFPYHFTIFFCIFKSFHYSTYLSFIISISFHYFFRIFQIFSPFDLPFFHIFQII
jgi:hypothetical protein